jgi:hypothetical protein
LIPVAINVTALSSFGLSPSGLGLAAVGILAHQCSFVLPIAAVAALTPNFRWYGAVAAGIAVGVAVVLIVTSRGMLGSIVLDPYADVSLSNAKAVVGEALLILGGGLVFAHQYLTRCTRRSTTLAVCFAGGYFLIAGYWPWSFGRVPPLQSERAPFDSSKVTLEVIAAQLNGVSRMGFSGKRIDGVCSLGGIPPDLYVQVRESKAQLIFPGGTTVRSSNGIPSYPTSGFSPSESSAPAAALGGIPIYCFTLSPPMTTLAAFDNDTLQKFKDGPAKLMDDFDFVAGRYEVTAEVPIAKGRAFDVGTVHAKIEDVIPRLDGVTLILLESTVLPWPGFSISSSDNQRDPRLRGDPVYLLVNRSRREAVTFSLTVARSSAGEFYLGGMLFQQVVQMPFGGGDYPHAPVLDKQWLADATFVCLERVPIFEFWKSAEIDLPKLGEPWLSIKPKEIPTERSSPTKADIPPKVQAEVSKVLAKVVFPEEVLSKMDHQGQASDPLIREIQLQVLIASDRQALLDRFASQPKGNLEEVKQASIYLGQEEQKKEGVSGRVVAYLAVTREGNVADVYVDEYSRPELAKSFALASKYSRFKPSDHETLVRRSFDLNNVTFSSGPAEKISNPALRDELLKRRDKDQQIRSEMTQKGAWDHPDEGLSARMRAIDQDNITRMRELLKQYGWPGPELIGNDGTLAAWLLVQHSDLDLQSLALPFVHDAFLAKKLPGACYALLQDRVLVGNGKPQVYGSQAKPFNEWKNHTPALEPIDDEANVDKRRAEVGLGPLAEYIQSLKSTYFPNEK